MCFWIILELQYKLFEKTRVWFIDVTILSQTMLFYGLTPNYEGLSSEK